MRKIRVLHVIKSLGRGGAEMLLPQTLRVHDHSRFDFHYIYFLPWKNQMVEDIEKAKGNVKCLPASNNIQIMFRYHRLIEYIKTNEIDVIHAHLPWAGVIARVVGEKLNLPVIYTEHNLQERYHFATRCVNLLTLAKCNKIVAVSKDVEQSIVAHKPVVRGRVSVILNGVNLSDFNRDEVSSSIRERYNIPVTAPIVGTVAVFRTQKRLDVWIGIAKTILESHPECHFIIVGDGPLRDSLLEIRQRLNLTDRVHFAGLQKDVRPYLKAFDIYMMSSQFEGLPVALLEAMAMECAVVATNAGGIGEVVRNNIEGLLCDVERPHELAALANKLLVEPSLRNAFGAKSRARIVQKFSIEVMARALEGLYASFK